MKSTHDWVVVGESWGLDSGWLKKWELAGIGWWVSVQ